MLGFLQTQAVNPSTDTTVPSGTNTNAAPQSNCPLISRALGLGSSGDDVERLQQFFAQDSSIYPERLVTGYFGLLTQAAVQRWQARHGIVSSGTPSSTGYGRVGPRTATALGTICNGGT